MLLVRRLPPVADNVHSSDDLTNGEETNHLSSGDTEESEVLGAGVADGGQDVLGRDTAVRGVAGGVKEVLEVGLEGGRVPS